MQTKREVSSFFIPIFSERLKRQQFFKFLLETGNIFFRYDLLFYSFASSSRDLPLIFTVQRCTYMLLLSIILIRQEIISNEFGWVIHEVELWWSFVNYRRFTFIQSRLLDVNFCFCDLIFLRAFPVSLLVLKMFGALRTNIREFKMQEKFSRILPYGIKNSLRVVFNCNLKNSLSLWFSQPSYWKRKIGI